MFAQAPARGAMLGAAASLLWLAGGFSPACAAPSPFATAGIAPIPEVTVEAPAVPLAGAGGGASLVVTAGLQRYAMSNQQLNTVRGGFFTNGIGLSFGFQQLTSVNGTVVQSILVPNTPITNGVTLPVYVTGQTSWTTTISETAPTTTAGVPGSSSSAGSYANVASNGINVSDTNTNGTVSQTLTPSGTPSASLSSSSSGLSISTIGNNGQTAIQTEFGGSQVASSVANSAGNQAIDQATTIDIGLSNLAQAVAAAQAANSVAQTVTQAIRNP